MRRFELSEGTASKFWEIEQVDAQLSIRWGRIGTQGQSQTKVFADSAKATNALDKLVKEKTGKGYAEVPIAATQTAPAAAVMKTTTATQPVQSAPANGKPAESLDAQCDRVFAAVCQQIANAEIQVNETVSVTQLKRKFGVSEQGASMAFNRLRDSGFFLYWVSPTPLAKDAQDLAKQLIVDLAHANQELKTATPPVSPSVQEGIPPWLCQGQPVYRDTYIRSLAYASRRNPKLPGRQSAAQAWKNAISIIEFHVDIEQSAPALRSVLERMVSRITHKSAGSAHLPLPDKDADTLLMACTMSSKTRHYSDADPVVHVIDYLVASYGLVDTVAMYLEAQTIEVEAFFGRSSDGIYDCSLGTAVSTTLTRDHDVPFSMAEECLRKYLSQASEADWQACADRIEAALPAIYPLRQPLLALLLPERPDLSNVLALRLAAQDPVPNSVHWLLLTATDSVAQAIAAKLCVGHSSLFWNQQSMVASLLLERGVDAIEVLEHGVAHEKAANALACIGTPEAVSVLARVASSSKDALARLTLAVDRWPLAAVAGLAGLIAAGNKDAPLLSSVLTQLLRTQPACVGTVHPWLEGAARAVIDRLLAVLAGPSEVAAAAELPPVLVAPPWLAKVQKKAVAPLTLESLPMAATEQWGTGKREAALHRSDWDKKMYDDVRKNHVELLDMLGMSSHRWFWYGEDEQEERWKSAIAVARVQAGQAIQNGDANALVKAWRHALKARKDYKGDSSCRIHAEYLTLLPGELAQNFWNAVAAEADHIYGLPVAIASLGLSALPGLLSIVRIKPLQYMDLALNFGSVELALPAARAFAKLKFLRETGRAWLLKFPQHAACGLVAPALGKAGEARDCAASALRILSAHGHEALLFEVAARYGDAKVTEALRSMLDESPLDRFPGKRTALPDWWQPRDWRRPVLQNGKTLPDEALDPIGQMLTFPTNEEVYAGIYDVKRACQSASLADFAFDCFGAWLQAGAPGKESWGLTALGLLGNDDTARKLTPFIRAWPGESAHARAVTGLDVLANIGSDVALMLLNGIAQKVKFKGLQDKAREKIDAIAKARELTTEELEDRLAPDLGLDEQGTLLLDFGPRSFKVGFDEALKPYVRECDEQGQPGARIADLPKPKKTDDAAKSAEAVERYKLLKKDARTIASQQLLRLEVAMCSRRRWSPELFRAFLVEHPLVRHIVQRLVWGVYELPQTNIEAGSNLGNNDSNATAQPGSNYGGTLKACFRVAEDGGYTTADDESFALPEATPVHTLCISVPHALELSAADAAAFGQVFADYELLQPFAQIGRDTWSLTEDEKKADKLVRWNGVKVPTGRILGLVNKGWRRGHAQDGGGIWYFTKPLGQNKVADLHFEPGMTVGMVNEEPEQTLGDVNVRKPSDWGGVKGTQSLGTLDAIAASELIRDMEALRV